MSFTVSFLVIGFWWNYRVGLYRDILSMVLYIYLAIFSIVVAPILAVEFVRNQFRLRADT